MSPVQRNPKAEYYTNPKYSKISKIDVIKKNHTISQTEKIKYEPVQLEVNMQTSNRFIGDSLQV